jgi:hypothetical protein
MSIIRQSRNLSILESLNRSIRNHESRNHTIKQSTNQVGQGAIQAQSFRLSQGGGNAHTSTPEGREFRLPLRPGCAA